MTESFAQLFEQSLANQRIRPGMILTGLVIDVTSDVVIVNVGLKSEAVIPLEQFKNERGEVEVKSLEFKVIKLDQKRNNVVVSRRAVVEQEFSAERSALMDNLQEGAVVRGSVKNLTDYGAFVDLGGIDGLLHITDMAWKRVKHPSEVVKVGDEIDVRILKFDRERSRVSLGLKQLGADPWENISRRYPPHTRVFGKVTNIADYGAFVEIEDGVEGLVHVSEMDWTNKNVNPAKVVHTGQEVEVMVLDVDEERRRISLGLKQLAKDPFSAYIAENPKGTIVKGVVKEVDARGAVIDLGNGIEGQLRASELGRDRVEDARAVLKVGEEVEAKFTGVDRKSRTISLSIKAKEAHEEAEAVQSYRSEAAPSGGTSLGDLLKEHIGSGER